MKFTKHALMGSSSLTRPLLLLGTASALMGAGPAYALGANALPQGGTVTGGSATISSSGNTLNVNQSSNRVIVDWQSFNVGSAATTNFAQPNSSSIAVNRVNASTNPSQIEGTINANGQVWILNPNGVFFGKTATVNAAGIVASTANINDTEFMSGSSTLHMTGGDSGKVVNEGNVTVGQGGLAAFVAPSVRNSGTINATVGKVSLAAGDSYTLDLAGDHLVEIATGATNAVVTQSGKIVNPGGTIEISAVAASAVVDSVINMSGVTTASSATSSGGQIVLGADDINVASTAQTSADGGDLGNGGSITMVANKTGSYDGSYSAQGGAQGGDGGNVETSGAVINLDPGISVNTSAANGKTGNWTLDPDTLDVVAGSGGDLSSGGNDDSTSTVGADTVVAQLATTNVNLSARNSITVASAIDSSAQTNYNTLSLNQESGATGILTVNLNAPITLGANQTLNGQASTINVAAGALIQNGIDVAGSTNTSSPALINVAAGTYDEALDILKNVDIEGAAGGLTIIQPTSSSQLVNTLTGHKYTSDMQVTVFVNGASNVTLNNLTIDGNDLGNDAVVFWNNSSGTISNSTIEDVKPFTGEQTGQGLAVDATIDNTDTLTVSNVAFSNWDKNAIDAETGDGTNHNGGNITLDVEGSSFTGAGATNVIAQNGIVLWEQGGGTINATINNSTFSDIDYTGGDATAAGVLQYGSLNGTVTVSNSTFNDTVQEYISTAGGVAHELDATNNNTFNGVTVSASTPLDELYTIENRIIDGVTSGNGADLPNTDSLVRLVTGNVYVTAADEAFGTAIQYAVNLATAGDTVNVQAGTYQEQVSINKSLTLDGAGSGVGGTIIEAPATIDPTFTTQVGFAPGTNVDAVVGVASTVPGTPIAGPVTIENLQVNGESNGNGNDYFMGIGAQDVDITVTGVDVTGARDNPLDGSQHGVGIGVFNDDGLTRTASITDSTVEDYQKNGIVAQGGNLAVTITGNTVTGDGNINTIAQNGIELFGLTGEGDGTITGTVSGNIVTGVSYDDPSDYATSIYLLDTDNVTVSGNTITGEGAAAGSSYGVSILGSDNVTISGNSITDTEIGVSIDDALYAPYFNASGAVGISNNLINSNGTGVAIAVNNAGLVSNTNTYAGTVTAFNNDLSGNTVAVDLESSNATANFSGNWWGTTSDSAIEASIAGSASSVDISPFLDSGTNSVALGTPGFNGDFSSITVTDTGAQTGATGRINEGLADATTGGTVNVEDGSYGEAILVSSPVILDFGNAVSATSLTVNSGLTGVQLSGDLAANSVTLNSAIALSGNLTLDTSAAGGNITTAAVDGSTAGGQSLTLNTGTGTASVGNLGATTALGAVIDNNTTTLTGTSYTAASFELGATTLASSSGKKHDKHSSSTDATSIAATGGGITLASVDGNSGTDAQALTLTATGTVSLGNVGGNTSYLVGDVNDNSVSATAATVLTGSSYNAASFSLGKVTLASATDATDITATNGGITLASVDGNSGTAAQALTLVATGTVSLGDVGDNTLATVTDVNDNGATTTLSGSQYTAGSFELGATTLTTGTHLTTITATGGTDSITLDSVDGNSTNTANAQALTLDANTVSLGSVGSSSDLVGAVIDDQANPTTLTGTVYKAISFLFGNLALGNTSTSTVTATTGNITAGTVEGTGHGGQNLTLVATNGTVSLNNVGNTTAVGTFTDTSNKGTTLAGSIYKGGSLSFGNLILENALTTITASSGGITTGTVDGSGTAQGQSLALNATHGTVSLGDVGDKTPATVGDVNDNGATTTLTGSKYKAGSFELGATTLTTGTHLTTITATSNATYGITLASVSGNSTNSAQALTLNANAVSLGNVGNNSDLVGAVIDDQANNLTALTGTNYKASSFLFGNLVLDNNTTIDATNGGITAGTVDGAGDALTLTASGTVSLGNVGGLGALGNVNDNDADTTLTGSSYTAASFDLGDTTLQSSSHLTTITANSVTLDSVGGNSTQTSNAQSLTLNAGAVSLGDVGNNSDLVGAVIDDQASNLTTLTGAIYKAISFLFGNVALGSSGTTSITATTGNITTGTVEGTRSGENLTLSASNGNVSLANVGDTGSALGTITDTSNHGTTLTGSIYKGSSLAFGNLILDNNTTITASSGGITTGTVDGDGTGSQSLALNASHGTVSLGDVGDNTGATVSDVNDNGATTTLTGSKYKAGSFELGATTLQSGTNLTTITAAGGADSITLASVSGDSMHTPEALTLNANAVSLGNVGNNSNEVGAVIDDQANNLTALTGTTYNASSFLFGNLTLASNTTITASTGSITTGSVEGTNSGGQNLTLNASHGNVSLNNAGDTTALGALTDTNNNGTTLTGSIYKGSSLAFGNLILDNNTTMTASNGGITTGTVDGSGTGSQSLNLTAAGTVSLGDVGDNAGATVSDVNDNGATTTLTGSKYKAGSFELGATTLQSGTNLTTITAAGGADSITLTSVSGDSTHTAEALTLNASAVSLGNVGNNANLVGAVIDDQANNLTALTGTTYNASSFLFGNLTLASNTSITASTGSITTGSVEGTNSGGQNLTLAAADGTVSLGNMGGLGTVIDTSNESTTLTGSSYNAASFDFGAVLLGANVTIATFNATGDITMTSLDGNTAGNQSLDIDGAGSVHLGNVGFTTALNDLDDDAGATTTTTLTGNTYNALTEEFDSNVLLTAGTTTITGTNGLMIVEVNGTTAGANNLTLVGPTTGLTYLGDTGSNVALGAVSAANPTVLYGDTYDANSFTFGQVEIAALPGASGTVNVNTSADNGQITMASVDELTGNPFALPAAMVLNAGTGNVSLGNVGATASLTSLTDTSNTTLTGGTYNAGSLTFGALTLDANTSLNTSARNGAITVASVNGSTAGGQSLTITAGTGNVSLGNTGASTQLGAVSDTSNTTLTGGTYNANSLNFGALTLDANTTLNTSADNGALTVASVNGSTVGGQSLTLNSGTGTISLGNTGASTRLGALSDSGTTTLMGSTYNANSFTFGGNVTLTAATTTLNSTQSASAAGDITFNANILGTSNGGQSLVLIAGPGTGAASANGNLTWQNAGTTTLELDNLTVSGNNLSALTAELTGNFTSTLTGNQAFADNTLNAGGNVLSNVGGNATGHIVAVGNVTLNAGGNITGTINGYNIDITAASLTNSDLTAVNDITVVAGLLLNDIFNAGQTVSIIANSVNGTTVTANTFDVSALTGSVNGTWNFLNATTGLNLRVNGELASFETFNGQQLVVEGFTLPIGTQIGANGALILPQGVLIGLLAPGGGQPVFVLVHSVQDLGALLSEGYVAIVIDLDGRKKDDDGMQVASN